MSDHDGQRIGNRLILHTALCRDYLCGECGGRLVTRFFLDKPNWRTVCANNPSHKAIIHSGAYERQRADAILIRDALPEELKAVLQ